MISVEMIDTEGLQIHRYEKKSFWISGGDERNFIDPHLWLDPWNAIRMVQRISQELTEVDPENARRYRGEFQIPAAETQTARSTSGARPGCPSSRNLYAVFHPAYTYLENV